MIIVTIHHDGVLQRKKTKTRTPLVNIFFSLRSYEDWVRSFIFRNSPHSDNLPGPANCLNLELILYDNCGDQDITGHCIVLIDAEQEPLLILELADFFQM